MTHSLKRHPLLWTLLALALVGAGVYATRRVRGKVVRIIHASRGPLLQTVVTSGRVRPQRLRLSALTTGRVTAVLADEGTRVQAGEVLVELDDREARARVAEARAALAHARVERRTVGSLQLDQAQEVLRQAEARAEEARRDLTRLEKLAKHGAVATATLEQGRTTLQVNDSALREARLQHASLGKRGVRARGAEAAVEQAQASLALAQAHLDYCQIRAPLPGIVIAREVQVGDVLREGEPALELAASASTELLAELDERNLALLAPGQAALASAEAFPDERFSARVSFIAPAVDPQRGTVEVRLQVDDPPAYLRPDMTVSIDIEVAKKEAALTLPLEAIRDLAGSPHVLTLRDGRVLRRPVDVGIRDARRAELLGGFEEEVPVIVGEGAQPGDHAVAGGAPK